jgi:hypothetical protein
MTATITMRPRLALGERSEIVLETGPHLQRLAGTEQSAGDFQVKEAEVDRVNRRRDQKHQQQNDRGRDQNDGQRARAATPPRRRARGEDAGWRSPVGDGHESLLS